MGLSPTELLSPLTLPLLLLPELLTWDTLDTWDISFLSAMLDTHTDLLPTLTELLSLLIPLQFMLPRLPMLLLVELSTQLEFMVWLMLALLPTPTVLLSQLSQLRLLLPVLPILLPMLPHKNH